MRHRLGYKDFISDNGFEYFHAVPHWASDTAQTDNAVNERKNPTDHLPKRLKE